MDSFVLQIMEQSETVSHSDALAAHFVIVFFLVLVEGEQGLELESVPMAKALDWDPPPNLAFTDGLEEQSLDPVVIPSIDWRELLLDEDGELKRRLSPRDLKPIESLSPEDQERLLEALDGLERSTPSE